MSRTFSLITPSLKEKLLFRSLTGHEFMSELPSFILEFMTKGAKVDPQHLIGKKVTVRVQQGPYSKTLHGIVTTLTNISLVEEDDTDAFIGYRAKVRPWLWLATQNNHYRVFKDKTVPEIIKDVLNEYPYKYKLKLTSDYRKWGFCVQYEESDFNFISRLMEHEGIYYWFEHTSDDHTLVIADDKTVHQPVNGPDQLRVHTNDADAPLEEPHFNFWEPNAKLRQDVVTVRDFNFNEPTQKLEYRNTSAPNPNLKVELENYQPVGHFTNLGEGEKVAKILSQIEDAARSHWRVASTSCYFTLASTVAAINLPDSSQNQRYLIRNINYIFEESGYTSGESNGAFIQVIMYLIPADVQYRHPMTTLKPYTYGPQTARVVGPAGESIYTDKYGRVKVQFHWDRYGKNDEESSCWVRVSHPWAGTGFGGIQIPRVNEEVIVDFLGGNPDRPVIVGRVYNADNMPPFKLPDHATQSGFHTRTKDGNPGQGNSVIFEDDKGNEMVHLTAQNNMDVHVKNDNTHHVGNASATNIVGAHTWHYKGRVKKQVQGNAAYQHENGHTLKVAGDNTDTVHQRQSRQYTGDNIQTIEGSEDHTVAQEPSIHHFANGVTQNIKSYRNDDVSLNKVFNHDSGSDVDIAGLLKTYVQGPMGYFAPEHAIVAAGSMLVDSAAKYMNLSDASKMIESRGLEQQMSMSKNKWAANQHQKTSNFEMKIYDSLDNMTQQFNESNTAKIDVASSNSGMEGNKMAMGGIQFKLIGDNTASANNWIELNGADIKKLTKKNEKYDLKVVL